MFQEFIKSSDPVELGAASYGRVDRTKLKLLRPGISVLLKMIQFSLKIE
jgi:hypothetical protein